MSYVENIFRRANLNSIREYLLYKTEPSHENISGDFEKRLNLAYKIFRKKMCERFPELNEDDPIFSELANLSADQEEIYMEIGIIVGIQIANEFKYLSKLINNYES